MIAKVSEIFNKYKVLAIERIKGIKNWSKFADRWEKKTADMGEGVDKNPEKCVVIFVDVP